MSTTRQQSLRSLSARFSPGHQIDWHAHDWSQLIYATEGAMTVAAENLRWVVPSRRAIWVPAGRKHQVEMHGRVFLRTVYVPRSTKSTSRECEVLEITPLFHELINHVCDRGIVRGENADDRTLIRFFRQQLIGLEPVNSALRVPADPRTRRFASHILNEPECIEPLSEIATQCGTSLRTLQRLFPREVGMSVSKWRHRVRMHRAIELLGENEPVTSVAYSLGFESVSAFIHSFKQCFGQTPGRYNGGSVRAGTS